jgi:putative ABC transport system permease protein
MIVSPKVAAKSFATIISCACTVLVCTLFLNLNIDILRIKDVILTPEAMTLYNLTISSDNMITAVAGGALALTSAVMLFFSIKHYIVIRRSELGILKALGHSSLRIAGSFWIFGLSVLIGTAVGFALAFALMPAFYNEMRSSQGLPDVPLHFNPVLVFYLIVLPTAVLSLMSIFYTWRKLKHPILELIWGRVAPRTSQIQMARNAGRADRAGRISRKTGSRSLKPEVQLFLRNLRRSTLKGQFPLVFFIGFGGFCYAATVLMSFTVSKMGDRGMVAIMMTGIGFVLAVTTLYIAITTVVKSNAKTIAMLHVFGYSDRECWSVILGGYRPVTYIGFALGTACQFVLMEIIPHFFNSSILGVSEYHFDIQAFIVALVSYIVIYEIFMFFFYRIIKRIPLQEVMQEE